jgi:hypothetical protein
MSRSERAKRIGQLVYLILHQRDKSLSVSDRAPLTAQVDYGLLVPPKTIVHLLPHTERLRSLDDGGVRPLERVFSVLGQVDPDSASFFFFLDWIGFGSSLDFIRCADRIRLLGEC